MYQLLQVTFNSPQSGWMSIGLESRPNRSFVTAVSHEPYDSLRDLILALSALLGGEQSVTVKWNREPEEYDFEMSQSDNKLQLRIIKYPDHRRVKDKGEIVFTHTEPTPNVCSAFWRGLRQLHRDIDVDEFDKNWRRPFPAEELRALTGLVRASRREAKVLKS